MSRENNPGFCKTCDASRALSRKGTNHTLHIVLSIISVGLWLPIWALDSIRFGGWICNYCGSKKVKAF